MARRGSCNLAVRRRTWPLAGHTQIDYAYHVARLCLLINDPLAKISRADISSLEEAVSENS